MALVRLCARHHQPRGAGFFLKDATGHHCSKHHTEIQLHPEKGEMSFPVSYLWGGDFSLKSPNQTPLLYYWPELCQVSYASANQLAGSSSCSEEAEGNLEKGSSPSQVCVLWGRMTGQSALLRQPVASATDWWVASFATENGCGSFWGLERSHL